jgi:myo-inositol-1(or 4)-monophosphatase
MKSDLDELLVAAEQIVREAGAKAREMIHRARILKHKERGDIVTEGDLCVEEHVISSLKKLFPDHGFISEEKGTERPEAEYVWTLDPIDGTKYYARDVPLWAISLALSRGGEPQLGIVFSPELDRLYAARTSQGATLNGRPIHCSAVKHLEQASICLEIPSRDSAADERKWALAKMSELVERAYRVRIIGVSSLGLCFCAAAGFDAFVSLNSPWHEWDVAAGRIILHESGADYRTHGRQIIAGPATLCDKIQAALDI